MFFHNGVQEDSQAPYRYATGNASKKESKRVELATEVKQALDCLKQALMMPPVLHLPFLLETDASGDRLGAVLLQKGDDRRYHHIACGSRTLNKMEQNYYSSKLEFLALK